MMAIVPARGGLDDNFLSIYIDKNGFTLMLWFHRHVVARINTQWFPLFLLNLTFIASRRRTSLLFFYIQS